MHAHIVLAHPEPQSYNAHLANVARDSLQASGWTATVSDLYAMAFDPCERASHYAAPLDASRFDAQAEQRHASAQRTLPAAVAEEIARLDRADLVVLQYPMWWHLPPAMLKGWFDRVFAYGDVYTSGMRFEHGRFAGRRAMLSVTVGTSEATYAHDGRSGDIELLLWPVHFTLAYVGFTVLEPFVAYGVEAGLRYSDPESIRSRLADAARRLGDRLCRPDALRSIPFHPMAEWGSDGRIVAGAPSHSPFIRHRRDLALD